MTIDIEKIRAAAEKATPAQWANDPNPTTIIALCDEVARLREQIASKNRLLPSLLSEGNWIERERAEKAEAEVERLRAVAEAARAVVRAVTTPPPDGLWISPEGLWWTRDAEKAVEELVRVCMDNGSRD